MKLIPRGSTQNRQQGLQKKCDGECDPMDDIIPQLAEISDMPWRACPEGATMTLREEERGGGDPLFPVKPDGVRM